MKIHDWLQRVWYGSARGGWLLVPLSWIFASVAGLRRFFYRTGVLPVTRVHRPVVVVGNITVGGTGKTPLTLWLAERLQKEGLRAGIASRGYGGSASGGPVVVQTDDDPAVVGDEALMMACREVAPVAVCRRRADAATQLTAVGADVILCDDGLQHYRLARDLEIAVVDGVRRFGNGRLLPAGPLREPVSRLAQADWVVCNGGAPETGQIGMRLAGDTLYRLADGKVATLDDFRGRSCHAVAAVGNPEPFFSLLRDAGIRVVPHPLSDHAVPSLRELGLSPDETVLMTEKDAVKCRDGAGFDAWFLRVDARLDPTADRMVSAIKRLCSNGGRRRGGY
ncbi:MAG: hypothetical protein AMJ59_05585 [Gammaproteobacteria bacterium SG8_31]|nr:MAG: hypothetical protein AMJ59_05585 [Gammaproteobacteria bacterium SG8_31]